MKNNSKITNLSLKESYNSKRILVTGGSGFIGISFILKILRETNSEIFNLDKIENFNIDTIINSENILSNRYKFLKANLLNEEDLKKIFSLVNPDFIFHFAAETHVDISIKQPKIFLENNIVGTFNLLNITLRYFEKLNDEKKSTFRFHHISTDEVYGSLGKKGLFNEYSRYKPRSPYSASKAASDHLVNSWHHTYDLPVFITNCSNNYGPWQYPDKLIPLIIKRCIQKDLIPIYGDGLNVRDWLFVDDHIDAILRVCAFGVVGKSYCIGGNTEKTNIEIVKYICNFFNSIDSSFDYFNLINYVIDRKGHDRRYAINTKLIKDELDWQPKIKFEDGLNLTINWYLKNKNWIKI